MSTLLDAETFPTLHLYPLNDTFEPKQVALVPENGPLKIGRQTNDATVPSERNGYFLPKTLSRKHAEIWAEDGKVSRITISLPQTIVHPRLEDVHQGCQVLERDQAQR